MEKILDYLNMHNINYLKLGQVDYFKNEKSLWLTFLYDENNLELINKNKQQIIDLVKNYVNLDINYNIKFLKAFLDDERLEAKIKNFLKTNFVSSFYALKNIESHFKDNTFNVSLSFSLNSEEQEKISNEILSYLNSYYFYNFKIETKSVEESFNSIQEHKNEILDNLSMPLKVNKMQVNKVESIIGEINDFSCYPYEYYSSSEENVLLCGNLINIEPIEFTKKDGNKGLRYSLTIKCLDKIFRASLFETKKNSEICKTIQKGIDIIALGDLDNFNNELTLKVKSLAKCEILKYDKPKYEINKEFTNYRYVSPIKYEEVSQINFFEQKIEKDYLLNNEFVVFDFETTGLEYMVDKVTEIGAVKIKDGKIVETFSSLIDPEASIPTDITLKTGITNTMVKGKPTFNLVVPDFYKFCKNAILVGHNVEFDYGFLDYLGRKSNYIFSNKREDTISIAKKFIFPKNYKLKTVAEYLNVSLVKAHRALNDALATAKVFIKLVEKFF